MSLPLFDRPIPVFDRSPSFLGPEAKSEAKRLSAQCHAILARLQQGPMTNREMSQIALSYTRRISDLREAGYDVQIKEQDHATGLTHYELRVL